MFQCIARLGLYDLSVRRGKGNSILDSPFILRYKSIMCYYDKLNIVEALSMQPQHEGGPAILLACPLHLAAYDMAGRMIAN